MKMVFILLNIFLATTTAQAATYYVATNGSDANPFGTLQQPFRTIVKGISVLKPGDTTFVREGTYKESIDTFRTIFPSGTSWNSAVTLAAYPGEKVTLVGTIGFNVPASYIIVSGLIIDANNGEQGFTIQNGAHHIRLQNSEVKNTSMQGIAISWANDGLSSSDYNEILNCTVHHIASYGGAGFPDQPFGYGRGHGIYMTTSHNIIRGNTFYDVGEYSIHQWNSPPHFANNNIIEGNRVTRSGHNTTRYGSVCCGGITVNSGNGTIVRNNVVYGNEINGIEIGYTCTNCKAYNNTTYNNPGMNIRSSDGGSGIEIRNNIAYPKGIYSGTGTVSSNNLTTNPNFVNAAGNDFHLLSSSPAINTGMTLSAVTTDFDGNPRPQGSGYDIGAFEYGSLTPAPPRNLTVK
jgi:parallel beta-helix repeat protein